MGRKCADCGRNLPQTSYTANQYSKGPGVSRCAGCVHGHPRDSPSAREAESGRYNVSNQAKFYDYDMEYPFAEGAFRWVAAGTYVSGPRTGQECVAKWFKTGAGFSADFFTLDIKAVDKALEIVNRFNQLNIVNKSIKINVPRVWTFDDDSREWSGRKALVEPLIQNYEKFNSNSGWNDDSMAWGGGGIYQREVVLSDPVILSRRRDYGVTDLGPDGISSFFSQHACNDFCRPNWTMPANPIRYFSPVPGTTMMKHSVPTEHSRPLGTWW